MADDDYRYITYETLDDGTIARIMFDRVETRNAQHRGLLVELNDAFLRAEADDTVRVVILGGNGPMFSSGPRHRHAGDRARSACRGRTSTRPA